MSELKEFRAAITCCAATLAVIVATTISTSFATADPCGMVPPIYNGESPIARKGLQQTYVFYRDGVESFVIRPGYEGEIDNFGMLIPFPNPPSIRKVHDDIFEQVKNAVDPPEVVIDIRPVEMEMLANAPMDSAAPAGGLRMYKEEVRVIKEEAVGMYEVVVLAAGSAEALKKWIDEHGFQFPEGMEDVTNEYIADNWCFVAVKTKVSSKAAVDPRPGQRQTNPGMPDNSIFEGQVQGLAFRFPTDELVVPMRLSAFNDGDLRNIVYLLTDAGKRIRNIPEEFVRRQITGEQLVNNVTQPLPLRVIGGTRDEIPQWQLEGLDERRNPVPHNGIAARLFLSDVLASEMNKSEELILANENSEKAMVTINERLGLRGVEVDNLIVDSMSKRFEKDENAMNVLRGMTLTIVDGDFSREVIAQQNLKFEDFQMAAELNTPSNYDAKSHRPFRPAGGNVYLGALPPRSSSDVKTSLSSLTAKPGLISGMSIFFAIILFGLVLRNRNGFKTRH